MHVNGYFYYMFTTFLWFQHLQFYIVKSMAPTGSMGEKTLVDCLALTFFKHQVQDFTRPPYDLQDDFPMTTWKPKVGPCRPRGPQGMVGLFSGHLHGLRGWKSGQALPAAGLQWRLLWGGDSAGNRENHGGCIWHLMGCYGDYMRVHGI